MSVLKAIAVFLCGFQSLRLVMTQILYPNNCPDVQVQKSFSPNQFLGKWYEAEKYFAIFEMGSKCVSYEFMDHGNDILYISNKQISSYTGIQSEILGEASLVSRSEGAKLMLRFPTMPLKVSIPYWIVQTDYDNFAVIWSCNDFGIFHTRNAWILTRAREPTLSIVAEAFEISDRANISRTYFTRTEQKNCPEYNNN